MKKPIVIRFALFWLLLSAACTAKPDPLIYYDDDPNGYFGAPPNELQFAKVVVGKEIVLNSAIFVPLKPAEGGLTIEFRRSDLEEAFIQDLFFGQGNDVTHLHPFARLGMEATLTDERLILSIHPGVILHLRNDIKGFPRYKTFFNEDIVGRVTDVRGDVYYSADQGKIKKGLGSVYISFVGPTPGAKLVRLPDGSIAIIPPPGVQYGPAKYPPRVVKGP